MTFLTCLHASLQPSSCVCGHLTQHYREMHLSLKCIFQVNDTLVPWRPTAGGAGKGTVATKEQRAF